MFKKNYLQLLSIFLILFTLIGFSFSAQAETSENNEPDQYVQVQVFQNKINDSTIRLAIEQTIYPNWHTYWTNPGDSGLPFNVEWNLPEGYNITPLEWATPQKISLGDLTNYGYEKKATLLQTLKIIDNKTSHPVTIKGKVNLLVCHDICIPETHDIQFTLNNGEASNPKIIKKAKNNLPNISKDNAFFYEENGNFIIEINEGKTTLPTSNIYLAPEEWGMIDNNANTEIEKIENGYRIIQKRGERELSDIKEFPFVVASNNNATNHQFIATNQIQKILSNLPTEGTNFKPQAPLTFVKALIFALLGGIVLNLMPCVFPVLSMKALSLAQLHGKEEKKARLYGLSYTAGILISFGVIAAVLIGLKAAGAQIGWGFQLQNPIVISLLAYLVFIIGLNLAGFFEFTNKLGNVGQNLASKSGNKGAFFTGVLATLVATPCTAPFMGAAMGYALTQGIVISMLVFLTLGFGLALPYLALCFIPALRTRLPKPGVWMDTFKQFLSFPMFLTTAFLIWVLSQQAGSMSVLLILSSMIAISFILWLWRALPKQGFMRIISIILLGISVLFVIYVPLTLETQTQENTPSAQNEQIFSTEKLTKLLEGDNPIFTNMTAAWCITCKVNERVAIKTNKVQNIFIEKKIEYLKGDWTNRNSDITQYLNKFGRQGVPLYVYYGPRDPEDGIRPNPIILPQILTPTLIKKTIQ